MAMSAWEAERRWRMGVSGGVKGNCGCGRNFLSGGDVRQLSDAERTSLWRRLASKRRRVDNWLKYGNVASQSEYFSS